jgi:hypothetical protein
MSDAKRLYGVYTQASGGLNWQGLPCPVWEELPANIQSYWQAVADTDRYVYTLEYDNGEYHKTVYLIDVFDTAEAAQQAAKADQESGRAVTPKTLEWVEWAHESYSGLRADLGFDSDYCITRTKVLKENA